MSDLVLHTHPDLAALAAGIVEVVRTPSPDPFQRPLLLVPGAGTGRWLSQFVARHTSDEGVFAGFDVHPLATLPELLDGRPARQDPWSPERLVWAILGLVDAGDDPALVGVAHHLNANDQRYANALRLAHLFSRYADHRPDLLAAWDEPTHRAQEPVDEWQPHLWRRLHEVIREPDPRARRAALTQALADRQRVLPWPSVHVFAPRSASASATTLLRGLAAVIAVHVWLPTSGPDDTVHPVGAPLGRRSRAWHRAWSDVADRIDAIPGDTRPTTTLGALQSGIVSGTRPNATRESRPDGSITVHASHGPARQVQVLRETLTAAFADDPTLEPRHVVIACPDPGVLAPHLEAAFTAATPGGGVRAHPATTFRVQVAEGPAADANRVYGVLAALLRLGTERATTNDLLALATTDLVARRFGIDADAAERLEDLLDRAGVRWGINQAHRARFGLDQVVQSTWQLGVQRLILGEAFSADRPTSVGTVATVDDVSSTDTALVGALAELVSRTSRVVTSLLTPASLTTWVSRLREAIELLVDVPFEDTWQLTQVWAVLDELADTGDDAGALLGTADAAALLDGAFGHTRMRPSYGNGSLVVCSLEALARVPHRVVCLVGLDERSFPRRQRADGDDFLMRSPHDLDPDPGADDRQRILDAVMAATQRLIVVYQGYSTHLNTRHNPPAGVLELVEAVGEIPETLQPFSPANFTPGAPRSFDLTALAAARALQGDRRVAPAVWEVGFVPRSRDLTSLDVTSLVSLLQHPAKYWLRQRAGVTIGEDDPLAEELPLELGPLDAWAIGNRMLDALTAGQPVEPLIRSEWLSGDVPPQDLGRRAINQVSATAQRIHGAWEPLAAGEVRSHLLSVDLDGVRLTGAVVTRGDRLVEAHYARISARHLAAAWVRVLLCTVATGVRTDAVLVGSRGTERLTAPPLDLAQAMLADLVHLADDGLQEVLPMPPRVAYRWARSRARGEDPLADVRGLRQDWKFDRDDAWTRCVPGPPPWERRRTDEGRWGHPGEPTALGALTAMVWQPLVTGMGA